MTIPYERTHAVILARELLFELARGDAVNLRSLRGRASSILKHFPTASDIDLVAAKQADLFAKTDVRFQD